MCEFYQIYNFGVVGHKHELIRFWGQRSRSQRSRVWSNKHAGGNFPHIFKVHGLVLMKIVIVFIFSFLVYIAH